MLLSPSVFPPVGYMAIWLFHPGVLIERYENFQKQSYRNRYNIAGPNGLQTLTIPVNKAGRSPCPITAVKIDYSRPWQMQHIRSLETAYNKSPFFLYYEDEIKQFIHHKRNTLHEFAIMSVELVGKMIGITKIADTTHKYIYPRGDISDLRDSVHPKKPLPWDKLDVQLHYRQVFEEKNGHIENLSVLDLIFNLGPDAHIWLKRYYTQIERYFQIN